MTEDEKPRWDWWLTGCACVAAALVAATALVVGVDESTTSTTVVSPPHGLASTSGIPSSHPTGATNVSARLPDDDTSASGA